ncbi:CDP-alcohol phosphatidyltransferase family protein [Candidatus Bathyarchaeota archaeon]|nr:CDP-alcohol phosphatidyltransferase family protein [Candidatus Bathyarchaeota archaeon]MBS7630153.1 CDP-alcohol phosphatidyltransferase family protein [Candidatus Bathyarchaeota archaeon]
MALVSSKMKRRLEELLTPGVRRLSYLRFSPNLLTSLGLVSSIAGGWFYVNWEMNDSALMIAGLLVLLSGFLDAVDGIYARISGKTSVFGGLFDSVTDRYSDAILLSAVIWAKLCDPVWGLTALTGSLMVSYTRARAEASGVNMASIGVAERAERMIILALATMLSYFVIESIEWGVILIGVLSHVTVLQRVIYFHGKAGK